MWIAKNKYWNPSISAIEKFAIERILQRCDYSEIISNKFRTTNGYTQLKELIHYCEITKKRSKSVKTLIVILEEAKSPIVKQNIFSDLIIDIYFSDLKKFILNFELNKLLADKNQPNLIILENLTYKLKIFEKQIEVSYYEFLKVEFSKIKFSETKKVQRELEKISDLIDLLIPFLVFKGYSISTISEIIRHWIKCNYKITISKILQFFHFNIRPFTFFQYLGESNAETTDFLSLMKKELNVDVIEVRSEDIESTFLSINGISNNVVFAKYSIDTLDPHKHIRSNFDSLLKKLVVQKERQSLAVFNSFFENSFWSNKVNKEIKEFKKIALDGDPINVNARGRTLRNTLFKATNNYNFDFSETSLLPDVEIEQLNNSIYYYNLALGSKSIENSLSLLWTSLEAVQPNKVYSSDIVAVQSFISKSLSIGGISRDIYSFALRAMHTNNQNDYSLNSLETRDFNSIEKTDGLVEWFKWFQKVDRGKENFKIIKSTSELLAFQYSKIAKKLIDEKQSFLLERLINSETSMKYQLQRIYHHRNKIVHSGDMINEYTNLWMHLEWYVGKILAYFIIQTHYNRKYESLEEAFMELEADQNYLFSYLEKNRDKPISEIPERIITLLFKHSWQAY
jgi:hypothetical protein